MKKICILALTLILTVSLAACGRGNDTPDTKMTILPDMNPTIDTNIPDPSVDTQMPIYTDGTDPSDWMDSTQGIGTNDGQTSNGH